MPRRLQALITVSWIMLVAGAGALAQQPQTHVQQAGSGLAPSVAAFPNLSIASGNVLCSNATVRYAGGQVTTLQNGVNYVYFDCGTSVPKSSTSPFTGGQIPLAVVVAQSSSYGTSGLLDVRPWAVTRSGPTLLVSGLPPGAETPSEAEAPSPAGETAADPTSNVTTSGGTIGQLPVFNTSTDVEDSVISQSTGNIGIGTTGPVSALNVAGTTGLTWTSGGNNLGLLTVGTPATGGSLYVNTPSLNSSFQSGLGIDGTYGTPSLQSVTNIRALGVHSGTGYGSQLAFWTTKDTTLNQVMTIDRNGNTGIGTTTPSSNLELQVNGAMAARITSNSGTSWSIDLSTGNTQQYACGTPNATVTVSNPTGLVKGELVTLIFVQNATTACSLSWPTSPAHIHGAMTTAQVSALGSINAQQFIVSNNGTDLYAAGPVLSSTGGTP